MQLLRTDAWYRWDADFYCRVKREQLILFYNLSLENVHKVVQSKILFNLFNYCFFPCLRRPHDQLPPLFQNAFIYTECNTSYTKNSSHFNNNITIELNLKVLLWLVQLFMPAAL